MNLRRLTLALFSFALLAACATPGVPLQVSVVSVERVAGGPMELRLTTRLRVLNANDVPIQYRGASVELVLNGKVIGAGVANDVGQVPPFGEAFVTIPVIVSGLGDVRRAIGLYGAPYRKLDVSLVGRLNGPGSADLPFAWRGELALPLPSGY